MGFEGVNISAVVPMRNDFAEKALLILDLEKLLKSFKPLCSLIAQHLGLACRWAYLQCRYYEDRPICNVDMKTGPSVDISFIYKP